MRRLLVFLFLLIALARGTGRAADPYAIVAILSLTGPGAFVGKEEATSLGVVEQSVNKTGGIDGRPLHFVVEDSTTSPQVAVVLANNALAAKATIILGSVIADCDAMSAVIKDRAVLYCLSPAFHPEKGSFGFSAGVSTSDLLDFIVRYARERGLLRLGMISTGDASGQDADRGVDAALARPENRGLVMAAREHFNVGDLTVVAQLARVKAAGAQALIAFNTGTPLGTVLHGLADAGLQVPVFTSAANLNLSVVRQYASYLPAEFLIPGVPSDAPDAVPNGPLKNAVNAYVAAFRAAGIEPDHTLASVWDPMLIVADALRKLGPGASATRLKDYLESLHGWVGANGEYDFRDGSQRGLTTRLSVMVRWDPGRGRFVAVSKLGGAPL
jgi:branched-chain amino acid transport system substrate-binding protein